MQNAMIGFSPESNWVTSKLPRVGGGNVSLCIALSYEYVGTSKHVGR
jgi:hypothetical protein